MNISTMTEEKTININGIEILIHKKDIKNFHLNVLPPDGNVRVSVPANVSDEIIRLFVIKKLPWIKKHIANFQGQARQTERTFVSGESHYFKGQRYILRIEKAKRPKIEIKHKKYIYYFVPDHYDTEQKRNYYENWLRKELRKELLKLIPKWEKIMSVEVSDFKIKKMKTKWGSCNPEKKRIWINLELIKKPPKHLEYIIVHEMLHFFEKTHNVRFKTLLSQYMPEWESVQKSLNAFIL